MYIYILLIICRYLFGSSIEVFSLSVFLLLLLSTMTLVTIQLLLLIMLHLSLIVVVALSPKSQQLRCLMERTPIC